jgi:uncharacterized membrane protein
MSAFYEQNDIVCAITSLHKEKLELYLNMYDPRIVTMEIMEYAILYGDIHVLVLLHHYVNQVFDPAVLKKLDKTNVTDKKKIKFLKKHYAGISQFLK